MGGERASTTRRREAGLLCYRCGRDIPTPPPPPTRRGRGASERLCETCEPRPIRVQLRATRESATLTALTETAGKLLRPYSVTFQDIQHSTERIGPWLLLDAPAQLEVIFRWGRLTNAEVDHFHAGLHRHGTGIALLRLTVNDRLGLIARGKNCPWTLADLLRLRAAGKLPARAKFRNSNQ